MKYEKYKFIANTIIMESSQENDAIILCQRKFNKYNHNFQGTIH